MRITLRFTKPGYIAHPYWPEMFRLIEITKKSGLARARTEANRRRALEEHLRGEGMTLDEYAALEKAAARPFHTDEQGRIVIPATSLLSCLVNASDVAPSKLRIPNLRVAVRASEFVTDKTAPDGVWERFAVVTQGSGAKASNQRGFRSNPFIANFDAKGSLEMDAEMVDPKSVLALTEFAGRVVGIGASRKMGWGRFTAVVD